MIGSLGSILAVLGRGTGPRGEKMAGRSPGTDSQDLASILDRDLGQTAYLRLEQLRLLRFQHCDIATVGTSETSTVCVETRQMSLLATEDICLVSTADICPVSAADICPVSTAGICPVSTEDIYPVSTGVHLVEDEDFADARNQFGQPPSGRIWPSNSKSRLQNGRGHVVIQPCSHAD